MQSNLGLTFETLSGEAGFKLTTASNYSIDVLFEDSPNTEYTSQTTSAIIFQASDEIKATSFISDGNVVLYLNKKTNIPMVFGVKFRHLTSLTKNNENQLKININGVLIYVDLKDCQVVNSDANSISVSMSGSDATIQFSTQIVSVSSLSSVAIQSVDESRMVIPASKRIPEFIISIYDDADNNYPRPLRFGVPVISTVPSLPQSGETLYQEDKDLLELGVGTPTRKMFFLIISDQLIDVSLRDNLSLEIDLPSGTDTVEQTASVNLEYVNTFDTNDVFSCEYDFHKEDTVNYVDGFAYLSVKMPLRIQRNLPLTFQVSSDGSEFVDENDDGIAIEEASGGVEDVVVGVDALSVETNAVQPKLTGDTQDSDAKKVKNKRSSRKPKA